MKVINIGADGRVIEDISKVTVPLSNPVYAVLRAIQREEDRRAAIDKARSTPERVS